MSMGRTIPTYRQLMEMTIADWEGFRRALGVEDRMAFDALIHKAREHACSGSNAAVCDPSESLLLSMLLEHEKELRRLRKEE
ncbi:MAG: hypothetical protein AB7E27_01150 [Candidatus Methanomethylophilaceae archaeon]|jgi:hypothetical protein